MMSQENMRNWNRLKQPPSWALKQIQAGRLKGKSDISPQWRYQAMTEVYGECGCGWKYTIDALWNEEATEGQKFAFARINLQTKNSDGEWSDPIPGIGGHMLLQKEKAGLHVNDEAYKMAITDALSTAMKMLGVAADVYAGLWDGAKYVNAGSAAKSENENGNSQSTQPAPPDNPTTAPQNGNGSTHSNAHNAPTKEQFQKIGALASELFSSKQERLDSLNNWLVNQDYSPVSSGSELTRDQASAFIEELEQMKEVKDQENQEVKNATANE